MSLDKGTKEEITKEYQLHDKDTGSADVQIAILTARITELTEHLKINTKDLIFFYGCGIQFNSS